MFRSDLYNTSKNASKTEFSFCPLSKGVLFQRQHKTVFFLLLQAHIVKYNAHSSSDFRFEFLLFGNTNICHMKNNLIIIKTSLPCH